MVGLKLLIVVDWCWLHDVTVIDDVCDELIAMTWINSINNQIDQRPANKELGKSSSTMILTAPLARMWQRQRQGKKRWTLMGLSRNGSTYRTNHATIAWFLLIRGTPFLYKPLWTLQRSQPPGIDKANDVTIMQVMTHHDGDGNGCEYDHWQWHDINIV